MCVNAHSTGLYYFCKFTDLQRSSSPTPFIARQEKDLLKSLEPGLLAHYLGLFVTSLLSSPLPPPCGRWDTDNANKQKIQNKVVPQMYDGTVSLYHFQGLCSLDKVLSQT